MAFDPCISPRLLLLKMFLVPVSPSSRIEPQDSSQAIGACEAVDVPGVQGAAFSSIFSYPIPPLWACLVVQRVKKPPAIQETWVRSLGQREPREKGKAAHVSIWPGEFHGLYSPRGHKESDTTERLSLHSLPPLGRPQSCCLGSRWGLTSS